MILAVTAALALAAAPLPDGGHAPPERNIPTAAAEAPAAPAGRRGASPAFCAADAGPPEYYAFPLVTTKNIPGTGRTSGKAHVTFPSSPFGVAVATDGSYVLDLRITFQDLPAPRSGRYVVWLTTPEVDRIRRLGVVDPGAAFQGRSSWNKFLVVVTLEADDDPAASTWAGPIVLRGMARSGAMHTMAGHGPFQQEKCAAYGYDG